MTTRKKIDSPEAVHKAGARRVAMYLTALSKCQDFPNQAWDVAQDIAKHIIHIRWKEMDLHDLSSIFTALMRWTDKGEAQEAVWCVADQIVQKKKVRNKISLNDIVHILHILSQLPDDQRAQNAAHCLAKRISVEEKLRNEMLPHQVSDVLDALRQWPRDQETIEAALWLCLTRGVLIEERLQNDINPEGVVYVLDALSRRLDDGRAQELARRLISRIVDPHDSRLRDAMNVHQMCAVADTLCKWKNDKHLQEWGFCLAIWFVNEPVRRFNMDGTDITNVLQILQKFSYRDEAKPAVRCVAERIQTKSGGSLHFNVPQMMIVLTALQTWISDAQVQAALRCLCEKIPPTVKTSVAK